VGHQKTVRRRRRQPHPKKITQHLRPYQPHPKITTKATKCQTQKTTANKRKRRSPENDEQSRGQSRFMAEWWCFEKEKDR
jgi:hypothetical protein